jgi:acyl carrier protein/NAD(P)-dependent dehydrogenase (short-subunit alcohol dehydrogenase family)
MLAHADVADEAAMTQIILDTQKRFGPIHGVVHAAGIAGGGLIEVKEPTAAEQVLRPKIGGVKVLDRLLDGAATDFVMLCSSLASVLGGLGRVDYVSANAYLDAYAHARTRTGRFTVSINWPAWREVGMAVDSAMPPQMEGARQESLARGIYPQEGIEIFLRALTQSYPQMVVAPPEAEVAKVEPEAKAASVTEAPPTHPRPDLSTPYAQPTTQLEQTLSVIWQAVLGIEPVGRNDDFFDLGGHSLLAVQIVARIREAFQIEFSLRRLFETPTIADLSRGIEEAILAQIDAAATRKEGEGTE